MRSVLVSASTVESLCTDDSSGKQKKSSVNPESLTGVSSCTTFISSYSREQMLTRIFCQGWNDEGDLCQSISIVQNLLLPVEHWTSCVLWSSCFLYNKRKFNMYLITMNTQHTDNIAVQFTTVFLRSNAVVSLVAYPFVVCHCFQSKSWGTSWYLSAPSTLGGVPRPRASPRTAGTPKSGAGHWTTTPHSSGSEEHKNKTHPFFSRHCERGNNVNICAFSSSIQAIPFQL